MTSPTPTELSLAQQIDVFVATAQAKTPAGSPLPWLLREPSELAVIIWETMTDAARGGAVMAAWALYLTPLGLPVLTWWAGFMIAFCARWVFPNIPNAAYVLYSARQDDEARDPTEAAAEALVHRCILIAAFLFALGAWGLLTLAGYFA